jgi:hypothetical protein
MILHGSSLVLLFLLSSLVVLYCTSHVLYDYVLLLTVVRMVGFG